MTSEAAWADSGAMYLTGRPDGPALAPPDGFVERLWSIGGILAETSRRMGCGIDIEVLPLLGERAAIADLHRGGDISCGGAARILPTAGGWLAVNLPRPDDLDLVPAWLGVPTNGDHWAAIAAAAAQGSAADLAERAQEIGLPVAELREPACRPATFDALPVTARRHPGGPPTDRLAGRLIVDLSSLWAGPLCTHLLQLGGARVLKVEAQHRPDGARNGPPDFFDLLHAGQESVALDFRTDEGRAALRALIEAADVVVEASRPRALEQLGLCAEAMVGEIPADRPEAAGAAAHEGGPRVWLSITGYGRAAPGRNKVAFGDDAAVAGGLVARDEAGPCFLADAVADPCAGLVSAAAVLRALSAGGRWLLDVSMRDVAAHLAGPDAHIAHRPPDLSCAPPRARTPAGPGPRLGQHTAAVLAEFGCP